MVQSRIGLVGNGEHRLYKVVTDGALLKIPMHDRIVQCCINPSFHNAGVTMSKTMNAEAHIDQALQILETCVGEMAASA